MKDIKFFNFENQNIRTLLINNEPFWIAKDVCDILQHSNNRKAIENLCDIETTGYVPHPQSPTKELEVKIVNESGLYFNIWIKIR